MKTLLKTIILALTLTVASTAFAQQSTTGANTNDQTSSPVPFPFDGNEKEFERAKLLLSGYHGVPSKETFEETLDHPKLVVMAIALDEDSFGMHRKHALTALGYWADAGVLRTYTGLLQDTQTDESLRHRLMLLIADHFQSEALGHLKPYLSHDDLQYRLTAIEAIRRLPGDDAVAALRQAKKSETNKVALERLEKFTRTAR